MISLYRENEFIIDYGIFSYSKDGLTPLLEDSDVTRIPSEAIIEYSEGSVDYDIVMYESGDIHPSFVAIKAFPNGAIVKFPLKNLRKLKICCNLPNTLIFNLPCLYHFEAIRTGVRYFDLSQTPLVSFKMNDENAKLKYIAIPQTAESIYVNSNNPVVYTDILDSNLDYFYLPNCSFFYSPRLVRTSVYLTCQCNYYPVAPMARVEFLPAEPQEPSSVLLKLFELHRKATLVYNGKQGNLRPCFDEERSQERNETYLQQKSINIVKSSGKSFRICVCNTSQPEESTSTENTKNLLDSLDNTFKMEYIDETFIMNSTNNSRRSSARGYTETFSEIRPGRNNQLDEILEEQEPSD